MAYTALKGMSERFDSVYAKIGRPSIPPEMLLRAQLLQMLYSVRSERLLMEEIDYSVLLRLLTVESRSAYRPLIGEERYFLGRSIRTTLEFSRKRSNTICFPSRVMSKVRIVARF